MGEYLPAFDLGAGRTAVALSAGNYHTCTILVKVPARGVAGMLRGVTPVVGMFGVWVRELWRGELWQRVWPG